MDILNLIRDYYDKRGLKWPTFDEAMKFVHTELAEVYELDLARIGGFIRNHPESKPQFSKESLEEELGDAIFMLLVAGMVEDVDPLEAMQNKMRRKLGLPEINHDKSGGFTIRINPEIETWDHNITIGDGIAQWWIDELKSEKPSSKGHDIKEL